MKTRRCVLAGWVALAMALSSVVAAPADDKAAKKTDGWQSLFDGKSLAGWRSYRKTNAPTQGWIAEGGILKKVAKVRGGDIVSERKFGDFDLRWEWRIAKDGNNGLKYLVTEERASAPGHEYQMLDDVGHPDGKKGPIRQTASFYDVLAPTKERHLKPPGEWNSSRVLVQGNHVEHWLNGDKVLEYELGSDALKTAIAKSKFKETKGFGDRIQGRILLTDHGDECWFRDIRIRELSSKQN